MQIEQINLYLCRFQSTGLNYSRWKNSLNYSMIYELKVGDKSGWGESTIKYGAEQTARHIAKRLIGSNASELDRLLDSSLWAPLSAYQWYVYFNRRFRQVREGLSIALHDLKGKLTGSSIYDLIQRPLRCSSVQLMPVIHVNPPAQMMRICQTWLNEGYTTFKIKLRGDIPQDLAAIRAIKQLREDVNILIVDANQGFKDKRSVVNFAKLMLDLGVSYFQNPIKASLHEYNKIASEGGLPLTCDTTSCWPMVQRVVSARAASLVNLHPNCMGGVDLLFRSVDFAAKHGLPAIIGSSGWFGIQDKAYQKLAFTFSDQLPSEEIGNDEYFSESRSEFYRYEYGLPDLVANKHAISKGTMVALEKEPGFGIEIDRDRLERVIERSWSFK